MKVLLNRGVFHYLFWSFTLYIIVYMYYLNVQNPGIFWRTLWFINENILTINLLVVISQIVQDKRLQIFSYISIGFKIILCVMNALAYAGVKIKESWAENLISAYWVIALIFYVYVSRKRFNK